LLFIQVAKIALGWARDRERVEQQRAI